MIRKASGRTTGTRRIVAGLLALALLCGLLPVVAHETAAAAESETSWAQEYLDQAVEWGVMRGDDTGDLAPTQNITRAEFTAMINRAYGYTETGPIPFTDVSSKAWYADDIAIAYNEGYFNGTSPTTASPDDPLTREQAVVILARNMMFEENAGEVTGFTDSRDFSEWSRSVIQSTVQAGLIGGYPDGSFRPQDYITREEVACVLTKAIGNLIQDTGTDSLGNVYGNVTINAPGVTLRNTTIAGDLYLTGGIGLGDVLLENVNVLGRIVVSGAGESNKGDCSVILRNVQTNTMVVDNAANQFVTLRTEGDTIIGSTSVRTSAYLEDTTAGGYGMKYIELNGEAGTTLQLAGNIKEVLNKTPDSHLLIASGTAEKVTIDEKARDASMAIEMGAAVQDLNLDVATSVSGEGDIGSLTVSAAGCTVAMLPDKVTIRPGLTANIEGDVMNSTAAAESSLDPRLTATYPTVKEIAPSSATAVFSTNKAGNIYWALTALSDGSTSEANLLSPPVYGGTILQSGTIEAADSGTEYTAALTDLISDGSYYLTAVMVDGRGMHSPVKVTAFTTPDDTVPAFADGYPTMTKVTCETSQVTVMTNKSCQLFYALLPQNSTAPTTTDFKAASITGNLGYGSVDAVKNITIPIKINSTYLEELVSYDLYLWLNDYDNAHSSAVTKLTFTTQDETPPTVTYMEQTDAQATSIGMTYALDEPGTLYWAIVKEGDTFFRPLTGGSGYTPVLNDETGADKLQIEAGVGAVQKGSSAFGDAVSDLTFAINNLPAQTEENPQSSYDLYYVAKDAAGNYSESQKITVSVADSLAPKVTQEFTLYNGDEADKPLANTNIRLVFSENVQGVLTNRGQRVYENFLEMYENVKEAQEGDEKDAAREILGNALKNHITFYYQNAGRFEEAPSRALNGDGNDTWIIDYYNATVEMEDGKMVITFLTDKDEAKSALKLSSGATYYFRVSEIVDYAIIPNVMGVTTLDQFTTVFATVNISAANEWELSEYYDGQDAEELTKLDKAIPVDMSFQLDPLSTSSTTEDIFYDLMIWSDSAMEFELYTRNDDTTNGGWSSWTKVQGPFTYTLTEDGRFVYRTLAQINRQSSGSISYSFDKLINLKEGCAYQYAVHVTKLGGSADRQTWNKTVNMRVTLAAGSQSLLQLVTADSTEARWISAQAQGVYSVGEPDPFTQPVPFSDTRPPEIVDPYPVFTPGDTVADMTFFLNREGTVYYVVTPVTEITNDKGEPDIQTPVPATKLTDGKRPLPDEVPTGGDEAPLYLETPNEQTIINSRITDPNVRQGQIAGSAVSTCTVNLVDLQADTTYYVYLMFQGTQQVVSDHALCYKFKTVDIIRPVLSLQISNGDNSKVDVSVDRTAEVYARLLYTGNVPSPFSDSFNKHVDTNIEDLPANPPWDDDEYTVLDAMTDSVGSQGTHSIFDIYAKASTQNTIANAIRSGVIGNASMIDQWGPTVIPMNGSDQMSFDLPDEDATYVCVAVAKSPQGGEDAFRAASPVQVVDKDAPRLITANAALLLNDDGKTVSGILTLNYDKYLYRVFGGKAYPLTQDASMGQGTTAASDGLIYAGFLGLFTSNPFYKPIGNEDQVGYTPTRTNSIMLELTDCPLNMSIGIPNGLYNKSGVQASAYSVDLIYDKDTGLFTTKITEAK